ncbi:MAG: type IV pilin N-terminal domain-containing protein [Methanophagales archaeon]|nr:type IV pilin N-terminal domain-containing protein [Methanophagales archaeon]
MLRAGVSEVVGYLLILSITVCIISVIYAGGMPIIEQTRENAAFKSMENAFIAMQKSIKKVAFRQSPSLSFKLNLAKGSVSTKKVAGNITIIENSSHHIDFGSIEYTLGSRKIIYENGAVIEYSPGGSIIISEPPIFFANYTGKTHIFISVINVSGDFSAGGGTTEMLFHQNDPIIVYNCSLNFVNISIRSSYAEAWSRFLNKSYENTFGEHPKNAGKSKNFCWLNISKGENGVASDLRLTLVVHNVMVSG